MSDKLSIYNGALRKLGERRLANLTENRESRRALDDAWDDDFILKILQAGQWNFATRAVMANASPDVEPDFGYKNAFDKPDDFVRTLAVCSDEYFNVPILQYSDEGNFWFSDYDLMYIKYVSSDEDYGADFSLWPPNFSEYAEYALAEKVCKRLTGSESGLQDIRKEMKKALVLAQSTDAQSDPTKFPPMGSWSSSRLRGSTGRRRPNRWGA